MLKDKQQKPAPEHLKHDINENPFFVMLHLDNAHGCFVALPLVDEDENICLFKTSEAAARAAKQNSLGAHFGYEIFEHGTGET